MGLLVFFVLLIVFTIIPIMVAARILKAEKTGFLACFIAAISSLFISLIAIFLIPSQLLSFVFSTLIIALCFSFILGASYIKSVFIALLALAFQIAVALLLGAGVGFVL